MYLLYHIVTGFLRLSCVVVAFFLSLFLFLVWHRNFFFSPETGFCLSILPRVETLICITVCLFAYSSTPSAFGFFFSMLCCKHICTHIQERKCAWQHIRGRRGNILSFTSVRVPYMWIENYAKSVAMNICLFKMETGCLLKCLRKCQSCAICIVRDIWQCIWARFFFCHLNVSPRKMLTLDVPANICYIAIELSSIRPN